MVLRLISRSPRRPGFIVTVVCEYGTPRPGWVCAPPQDLTPASGRQNHTTSPSANPSQPKASTGKSVCRLRAIRQLTGHIDPPCHPLTSPDALASTASRPASVTIAIRPSKWDETMRISELICLGGKQKYFCKRGWTSHFGKHEVICPSGRFVEMTGKISPFVIPGRCAVFGPSRNDGCQC